jgi:hypothetical protein
VGALLGGREGKRMRHRLRRFWQELWYDPMVDYQRAKDLLAKRLSLPDPEMDEPRRPKLRLWKSQPRQSE